MSDYKGVAILLDSLPKARELLVDRGYDDDWFRNALLNKGISPCIPDADAVEKSRYLTVKSFINSGTR